VRSKTTLGGKLFQLRHTNKSQSFAWVRVRQPSPTPFELYALAQARARHPMGPCHRRGVCPTPLRSSLTRRPPPGA